MTASRLPFNHKEESRYTLFFVRLVPRVGLEPTQPFLAKGFSHHTYFYISNLTIHTCIPVRLCSPDYFTTVLLSQLRFLPYSLYAVYPVREFREPSPKSGSPCSRFLFVRKVLLTKFPLWHSCCSDLCSSLFVHGNWDIVPANYLSCCHVHHRSGDATPTE